MFLFLLSSWQFHPLVYDFPSPGFWSVVPVSAHFCHIIKQLLWRQCYYVLAQCIKIGLLGKWLNGSVSAWFSSFVSLVKPFSYVDQAWYRLMQEWCQLISVLSISGQFLPLECDKCLKCIYKSDMKALKRSLQGTNELGSIDVLDYSYSLNSTCPNNVEFDILGLLSWLKYHWCSWL